MTSIFDHKATEEIVQRIHSLRPDSAAHWGKMNVYQMLRHCTLCEQMMQGEIKIKRVLIGRLLGKMVLRQALADGKPFGKNSPTSPILKTTSDSGDFEQQRKAWLERISQYQAFSNYDFVHPFFGKMSKDQIGVFVYKHADHHLRQFGA